MLDQCFGFPSFIKHVLAGCQLKEHNAIAVDVHFGRQLSVPQVLVRQVILGSVHMGHNDVGPVSWRTLPCEAEVTNLGLQVAVQQDISTLDVPVDEWATLNAGVQEVEASSCAFGNHASLIPVERRSVVFASEPVF